VIIFTQTKLFPRIYEKSCKYFYKKNFRENDLLGWVDSYRGQVHFKKQLKVKVRWMRGPVSFCKH